jgi:hypothetical protein
MKHLLNKIKLPNYAAEILEHSRSVFSPKTREDLLRLAFGEENNDYFEVKYVVDGIGTVVEANVTLCKNGAVVNYTDDYMRRRDPDCLLVADKNDTDKPKYDGHLQ